MVIKVIVTEENVDFLRKYDLENVIESIIQERGFTIQIFFNMYQISLKTALDTAPEIFKAEAEKMKASEDSFEEYTESLLDAFKVHLFLIFKGKEAKNEKAAKDFVKKIGDGDYMQELQMAAKSLNEQLIRGKKALIIARTFF